MIGIEVAEVGSVDRFDRMNDRRQKGEVFGVMLEDNAKRLGELANMVSAVAEGFGDGVRSTEAVCEFGKAVKCCVTLNLDTDHNYVVDTEEGLVAVFVHAFSVVGATFLREKGEDFGGEGGVRLGEAEESVNSRHGSVDGGGCGSETDVERELELTADRSDAADNVSAVDRAAVPGISGAVG
jgi:hypothetical protein